MKTSLITLLFAFCSMFAQETQVPPVHYARERTYDVLHYKLNLEFNEVEKSCAGDVTVRFIPLRPELDVVLLDAAEMNIDRVRLNQQNLKFAQTGDSLLVELGKPYTLKDTLELVVSYSVSNPKKGLYFVAPDSGYPDKQYQFWTQGEPEDNHYWFPCYDFPNDRATSEMIATVNDKFTVISNGRLIDVKRNPKRHTATYHWLEDKSHVSYLISIIGGEYAEVMDTSGAVPIMNYVYKRDTNKAMNSFAKTRKMMDLFAEKTGYPYPWEKYAQTVVEDFIFGGEENVSATTLNDNTIHDERAHLDHSSDPLVSHELAHQWWGDLVSFKDWSHGWLSEGFATYFEILFREFDKGHDDGVKDLYDAQGSVIFSDIGDRRRPTVCNRYSDPIGLFDNRIYQKGACVLNMLRDYLGDELFWKAMKYYIRKHAFQTVETNDLKVALEEATGYNLYWFFDQWLYKAGYPEFDISSTWNQASRTVDVKVKQTQLTDSMTGIFKVPVDIEVWVNGSPEEYRVMVTQAEEVFSFTAYQKPQLVIFDKGSKLLKKANFQKSVDEWIFQLQHASEGIDRYVAVEELRWMVDSNGVANVLRKAALEDHFWEVRRNAAYALGDSKNPSMGDTLLVVYGDREARVRAAVTASLRNFKGPNIVSTLVYAFENDPSYAVAAGALTALVEADTLNAKRYCAQGLGRDSYRDGIRMAALRGLSTVGDEEALKSIKEFTKYGIKTGLRVEALRVLGRTWKSREDVIDCFVELLHDPNFNVRQAVIEILGTAGNIKALGPLQQSALSEKDGRLISLAREAMEKIKKSKE